jgi:16S rRNA processing protein RimM
LTLVTAGRVGKPHGLDGSFYVEGPRHALPEGCTVFVQSEARTIERRAGTDDRPLIRLTGVSDPRGLGGELLLVEDELGEGEWLAADLVGCRVPELGGVVARILDEPSCSVLELEDGTLIPLISDAVERVDLEAREIHVNRHFLG